MKISWENRKLLVGLVKVFVHCGAIQQKKDIDDWLNSDGSVT